MSMFFPTNVILCRYRELNLRRQLQRLTRVVVKRTEQVRVPNMWSVEDGWAICRQDMLQGKILCKSSVVREE